MGGTRVRGAILRLLVLVPMLAAALALGSARPAEAKSYNCVGEVANQTIKGSVIVPPGETCSLRNAVVTGGVTVRQGGVFYADLGTDVRGSISASNAVGLYLYDSLVRGSVGSSGAEVLIVNNTEFRGNVSVSGVRLQTSLVDNVFGGAVVLNKNGTGLGGCCISFVSNTVALNVFCNGNAILQFFDNQIAGSVSTECYAFSIGG